MLHMEWLLNDQTADELKKQSKGIQWYKERDQVSIYHQCSLNQISLWVVTSIMSYTQMTTEILQQPQEAVEISRLHSKPK